DVRRPLLGVPAGAAVCLRWPAAPRARALRYRLVGRRCRRPGRDRGHGAERVAVRARHGAVAAACARRLAAGASGTCLALGGGGLTMPRRKITVELEPMLGAFAAVSVVGSPEDRVLDAAAQLMRTYGLKRWSMEDVAELAAIGRTSVYRAFSTRDELVHAVLAREL